MTTQIADSIAEARVAFSAGDIAGAERRSRSAADADPVLLHELLADIAYAREDVPLAMDELVLAVNRVTQDRGQMPRLLARLARLGTLTFTARVIDLVRSHQQIDTADENADERVATALWLAHFSLLDGDAPRAWQETRAIVATNDVADAAVKLTQAHILRAVDDYFAPEMLTREAADLIARADHENRLHGPIREIVIELAVADAAIARDLLARTKDRAAEPRTGPFDRFSNAAQQRLRATVARSEGKRTDAQYELGRAFAVNDTGGFVATAAAIALELVEHGRYEYVPEATDLCRFVPRSWIAKRASHIVTGSDDQRVSELTPAQRDVLFAICAGKSAKEIALDFDRSSFTIRNHTKEVFRVFNLRSRASLIAECARTGIYPPRDGVRLPRSRRRQSPN